MNTRNLIRVYFVGDLLYLVEWIIQFWTFRIMTHKLWIGAGLERYSYC